MSTNVPKIKIFICYKRSFVLKIYFFSLAFTRGDWVQKPGAAGVSGGAANPRQKNCRPRKATTIQYIAKLFKVPTVSGEGVPLIRQKSGPGPGKCDSGSGAD